MTDYTLEEIAKLTQSNLFGEKTRRITGVDDLETATPSDAAFLQNPLYEKQMRASEAGVIFITPSIKRERDKNYLVNENPSLAFQQVIELFIQTPYSGFSSIHPSAVIHKEAQMGKEVTIGPHAVIDRKVIIGDQTIIGPNVSIGPETIIGKNCLLHPNVVIREGCVIGNRVIIQPGAVIGACGFGYYTDSQGHNHKLKQVGNVILEDEVEIGSNTVIDRGRFKTTHIGSRSKLDNLVQIAHRVQLGEDNLLASQVGIAGSTKTGRNVVMGGQVGVTGHITIKDAVMLAARAAVSKSIEKSGVYSGIPAAPIKKFNLHFVQLRSIGKLIKRIKELESKLIEFEKAFKN